MAVIQIPPDGAGKYVDTVTLTDALVEVHRQKMVLTGASGTAEVVAVVAAAPAGTEMGLVVRHAGTATVAGNVTIASTAQVAIGTPFTINNISATVAVSGQVSLGPGTSNIGTINNISAAIVLAAGTNNIGFINNISASVNIATGAVGDFDTSGAAVQNIPIIGLALPAAGGASVGGTNANPIWVNVNATSHTDTVVLAAGTNNIGTVNNISATVTVSGTVSLGPSTAVIGTLNNISATVTVAGTVSLGPGTSNIGTINNISAAVVLAAGTNNIGTINNISASVTIQGNVNISTMPAVTGTVNISGSAVVAVRSMYVNAAVASASRGPRCLLVSTSANVTLIAAPGVGMAIHVTAVYVSNASGTNTRARIGTSASIGQVQMMMAASGGGFVMPQFTPIWELSANEALLGSVKPNASEAIFNIHYFVASADAL